MKKSIMSRDSTYISAVFAKNHHYNLRACAWTGKHEKRLKHLKKAKILTLTLVPRPTIPLRLKILMFVVRDY